MLYTPSQRLQALDRKLTVNQSCRSHCSHFTSHLARLGSGGREGILEDWSGGKCSRMVVYGGGQNVACLQLNQGCRRCPPCSAQWLSLPPSTSVCLGRHTPPSLGSCLFHPLSSTEFSVGLLKGSHFVAQASLEFTM